MDNVTKRVKNLEMPELIKSTKLRKYIATVAQIASLNENELEWLSGHLGHNMSVHREYYRLHDSAVELSKVSRMLMAVDAGQGKDLTGKTLAEIQLDGKGKCFQFL